ncbi:aminopeptidase NAALADL1-like [Actinia tenebrosa]|uniref:Aminopeptidase NAALADL1-like n=1 Tax=Actinia tenebrosa TaxID=6105 RepID=A0A6P8I7G9_ACTTE|nr:aminopeptidase NAALADL1-like [Actinia tenebrosa]
MSTELSRFGNRNNNNMNSEFSSQIQLKSTEELFKPERRSKIVKGLLSVLVILIAIAIGFVLGYFVFKMTKKEESSAKKSSKEYLQEFKNMIDPKELEHNLRMFTIRPHISTTHGTEIITNHIRDTWQSYGFEVEEPEYEVLMSFPQEDKPNKVSIINNDTKEVEYDVIAQVNVTAGVDSDKKYKYTPYLAYAPNGTVEGELVYANLGSQKDFEELAKKNISLKGKIVIIGNLFGYITGAKNLGAVGVILYPDPKLYAPNGHGVNDTFPNSPWVPPDAVHSIALSKTFGDALTPMLPSSNGMHRIDLNKAGLLSIPAQTISYQDAQYILSRMKGEKVPKSMEGGLNLTYRFGPGFNTTKVNTTLVVRLEVNNQYVKKKIRNVIATIPGSEEPDRYVLIGNHRDAWFFGASDPSSGTATMMEMSRVLWKLRQKGWRPRRTIKLCSWGGEEFALLGSHEWVEEYGMIFRERAVAYLNTDVAVGGNFVFYAQTSPMLGDLILKNAKKTIYPSNISKTIYDNMLERLPKSKLYPDEPMMSTFRFVTDNIPFCLILGLPTADFSYFFDYTDDIFLYPLYHTQYDAFDWIKKFADPNFLYFKSMAQFLGSMLFDLSDSEIIPFSLHRFVKSVHEAYDDLKKVNDKLDQTQMLQLEQAIKIFANLTTKLESTIQNIKGQQSDHYNLRMLNDQIAGVEKTFVSPYTIRASKDGKKIIDANSFIKIHNALHRNVNQTEIDNLVKFEMSLIIRCFNVANKLLEPIK